jgi:zinc protease
MLAAVALSLLLAVKDNTLTIKPVVWRHRTLANGLELYDVEDHASPTVALQVWYRVGSKDDPAGRSGFAHLFEHLMFKSTAHMPSEMLDRLTEDVGGANNASTNDDVTNYYEDIPSNYLQTLLWAEGERMGSLTVDEANFKSEREVVKEEYRTSVLGAPYGLFEYDIDRDSFVNHPYRRPTIGSIEDLDAATLTDVQQFHSTFYRPDNAVLVVAGDFEPAQLDAWVDRYLGVIARPSTPIPRVHVAEPPREETKHLTEKGQNVPLPALAYTWLTPSASSPDMVALRVAAALLGFGDSSRLEQSLVYKGQIAQDVNVYEDSRTDVGLFVITATLASGKTPETVGDAIERELKKVEDAPVAGAELAKVKNLLVTAELRQRETNQGRAFAIGHAATIEGDVNSVNSDLQALQAVTADDVQRVLQKYLRDTKPLILTYVAGGAQ